MWQISGRVYRDREIFEAEQGTIFSRCWIFVAHESEVAQGGDYKVARIGRQPVIVSRNADDGAVQVMFNRCRPRGSAVCQRERSSMPELAGERVAELRSEVETFLFHEAALLDGGEHDRWLELFAEDATYWIPSGADDIDPTRQVSIVYDELPRLRERVWRLGSGMAWAQEPPSRTLHMVANVQACATDEGPEATSALLVTEFRRGRQHAHAARCRHELRRTPDGFLIARKKIDLVNNDGHAREPEHPALGV